MSQKWQQLFCFVLLTTAVLGGSTLEPTEVPERQVSFREELLVASDGIPYLKTNEGADLRLRLVDAVTSLYDKLQRTRRVPRLSLRPIQLLVRDILNMVEEVVDLNYKSAAQVNG